MRSRQLTPEIMEGECHECGMVGPLISVGSRFFCEDCEKDVETLD